MQLSFSFDTSPILPELRGRLRLALGSFPYPGGLKPIDQLVKSMISSRTYDATSQGVFDRLKLCFADWTAFLDAPPETTEALLKPLTYAGSKAEWLPAMLWRIKAQRSDFDLDFLKDVSVEPAMTWLEGFAGVGQKVAAAVLNFSTLRRPVMVVDTHVWRVATRFGLASARADLEAVRRIIMQDAPESWDADDFYELHWLMKSLGQIVCQDGRPRCGACPLARQCASANSAPMGLSSLALRVAA